MKINPIHFTDFYKTDHRRQYPKGTNLVYSNITARKSRLEGIDKIVFFGLQYFIKEYLIEKFNADFFNMPKDVAINMYKKRLDNSMGKDSVSIEHIEKLWNLQYLPLRIKALEEGDIVDVRIPFITIVNTHPEFFWLTNFIETMISSVIWTMCTAATLAYEYKKILTKYSYRTGSNKDFIKYQAHDFSFRGLMGVEAACMIGASHLTSFVGTDTLPAIDFLEKYYDADSDKELIGCSVPATEHSVMCLGGKETEYETFKRLITEVYPTGIVSIVSDSWDFWKVITEILPRLKNEILSRNGRLIIRPDSGDPVKIICGDTSYPSYPLTGTNGQLLPQFRGAVQCLWDIFGGNVNESGYRELDEHIGLIYGDSITLDRCKSICSGLEKKGFASSNIIFGVGSFTYQYVTRDTFGFAIKSTYGEIDNNPYEIFKDPVTDNVGKKSAKGLLKVTKKEDSFVLQQCVSKEEESEGLLKTIFCDGKIYKNHTLNDIRKRLEKNLI